MVLGNIFGFVLNVPSKYKLFRVMPMPLSTKHWIAIKRLHGDNYYNLDSDLKTPEIIGNVRPNFSNLDFQAVTVIPPLL